MHTGHLHTVHCIHVLYIVYCSNHRRSMIAIPNTASVSVCVMRARLVDLNTRCQLSDRFTLAAVAGLNHFRGETGEFNYVNGP